MGQIVIIRRLEQRDVVVVAALGARMHGETRYRNLEYSEKAVIAFALGILERDDYFVYVADENGRLCGMLVGYVVPTAFGRDKQACDLWFYVVPEKRGTMTAKKLVKKFYQWAREQGAHSVVMTVSSGINDERVGQFLERIGFRETMRCYERGTKDGWQVSGTSSTATAAGSDDGSSSSNTDRARAGKAG